MLGTQPAHIRVEWYVPQTLVLPHCHVVVSHGGSGTVLSSLTLGLPQLCLPQGADQFLNAAAVATSGAGISLVPLEATAPAIRDAATRLISEASFRSAAAVVVASIASMPSPDAVAAVLEDLVQQSAIRRGDRRYGVTQDRYRFVPSAASSPSSGPNRCRNVKALGVGP